MAWAAELETETLDDRGAGRRKLHLGAHASRGHTAVGIQIHNLSSSGMLIESSLKLATDDILDVQLPEAGTAKAHVIWHSDQFYGCEFEAPLSRATVSAALLRSPSESFATHASTNGDSRLSDWNELPEPFVEPSLSPRAKLATITGLAALSWGAVALVASAII